MTVIYHFNRSKTGAKLEQKWSKNGAKMENIRTIALAIICGLGTIGFMVMAITSIDNPLFTQIMYFAGAFFCASLGLILMATINKGEK